MDGNGRWAAARGLKRVSGHREGVRALKRVLKACETRGIPIVSVYAFSTENWKRPKEEVDGIFSVARELNDEYFAGSNLSYRVNFLGETAKLPLALKKSIKNIEEKTGNNQGMTVNVMLNYGGRAEIVRAAARLAEEGAEITEEGVSKRLYTCGLPDPDLIVRTGGEKRLSNFMVYQSAYSELLFIDKLWPDMEDRDIEDIIKEYGRRDRRFGGI